MKTRWLMMGLAALGLVAGLTAADDNPEKKDEPKPASRKKTSRWVRPASPPRTAEPRSSTNITRDDPSTCHWRTVDRTVGGDVIPLADEFVMVWRAAMANAK